MATRRHPVAVFLGVAAAYVVQSLVAVVFGGLLRLLPPHWVRIGAGLMFLGFAAAMWIKHEEPEEEVLVHGVAVRSFLLSVWGAFLMIFVAEWGDLTQLTTVALIAKHHQPWTIFWAATLARWTARALAIAVGNRLKRVLNPRAMQPVAAAAFALVGLAMLLRSA